MVKFHEYHAQHNRDPGDNKGNLEGRRPGHPHKSVLKVRNYGHNKHRIDNHKYYSGYQCNCVLCTNILYNGGNDIRLDVAVFIGAVNSAHEVEPECKNENYLVRTIPVL